MDAPKSKKEGNKYIFGDSKVSRVSNFASLKIRFRLTFSLLLRITVRRTGSTVKGLIIGPRMFCILGAARMSENLQNAHNTQSY